MAPKRRGNKVVGSVVKTKVVQETVEVIVADDDATEAEQHVVPEALDVSGSTVVHVEVTTPDGGDNVKQPTAAKRGRARREEEKQPAPPEDSVLAPQSQETQDPNEEQAADDDASKKKATPKKSKPKPKPKPKPPQQPPGGGDAAGKKRKKARRRLGQASAGGDAGMGGIGGYKRYVWRVLKQVHPDLGVSGHAMQVLDMMMADMFERLADEAARLSKATGKMTLTSREVQSAVRLVLPGELGKHAISEGIKAISKYTSY